MISPTRAGIPSLEVRIPNAVATMRNTRMESVVRVMYCVVSERGKN